MAKTKKERQRNRVKDSIRGEAKSRAYFARKADLSEQTLKRVEEGNGNISQLTKNKIVRAFNELEEKRRDYTEEYLFPDG